MHVIFIIITLALRYVYSARLFGIIMGPHMLEFQKVEKVFGADPLSGLPEKMSINTIV